MTVISDMPLSEEFTILFLFACLMFQDVITSSKQLDYELKISIALVNYHA